ncbi:MAG: hypothetical protein KGL46_08800 [Hyphomicrobiales bacterium]|nr:hypothetical protein [Hyphomicrobiales bacterium]
MSEPVKTRRAEFHAPYGREIRMEDIAHESGMKLLRITIREGRRFTILDLDATTAATWAAHMQDFIDQKPPR